MSLSAAFRGNLAAAAYQLGETRFAESLFNGVIRGVEDWAKPAFHLATAGELDADLAWSLALLSAGNFLSSSLNSKTSRSRLQTRWCAVVVYATFAPPVPSVALPLTGLSMLQKLEAAAIRSERPVPAIPFLRNVRRLYDTLPSYRRFLFRFPHKLTSREESAGLSYRQPHGTAGRQSDRARGRHSSGLAE